MSNNPELEPLRREAYTEAARFALPPDWQEGRDLVSSVTIDGPRTRDRDDGIWLKPTPEGEEVRVSITDVGSIALPPAVMQYAEKQGETRYLRTTNIPMIPPDISEGVLSLLDGQDTPVVSVNISLDPELDVADVGFSHDYVNPYRMTYGQVNRLTHGDGPSDEVVAFRRYELFALKLLRKRQAGGAFAFYDPNAGVMTGEDGELKSITKGVNHSGQLIVQEFMILANTVMAEYLFRNNIPALFRNHQMRSGMDMQEAMEALRSGNQQAVAALKQGFGRARFSPEPTGHDALNLPVYAPWTSPLRRFADVPGHMNLAAHLRGDEYPFPAARLEMLADRLNAVQDETRARKAVTFKEIAEAVANQDLGRSAEELLGLDPDAFSKVISRASRTGLIPGELRRAIGSRELQAREVVQLLFHEPGDPESWEEAEQLALLALYQGPHKALSVINGADQLGLIDKPTIRTSGNSGDVTDPNRFTCTITTRYRGEEKQITSGGSSKKVAQQNAAVSLLVELSDAGIPAPMTTRPTRAAEALSPALTEQASQNPKGALLERFQKLGGDSPDYQTEETWTDGTNHRFQTTITVVVDGQERQIVGEEGTTKKEAEAKSSKAALVELADDLQATAVEAPKEPVSDNPISALQERSQMGRLAMPKYTFKNHGALFECTVTVVGDDGEVHTLTSPAKPTKKEAKTAAAEIAWGTLHL